MGDIKEYALQQAVSGKEWKDWKLVEGRSNRKYVNDKAVADKVESAGYDPYEKKVIGITAMTKMLGKTKFEELLSGLIEKPQGKPTFSNIEQQSLEFVKYTLEPWLMRWEQSINRALLSANEKSTYFVKFNVDGLLRGDYQSRMNGYATARQNGWMSANDIRELENLDLIPEEDGGDLYLINGNMTKLADAGIFANGGKENADEEVLEVEEQDGDEPGDDGTDTGEDTVSKRNHRRRKLV